MLSAAKVAQIIQDVRASYWFLPASLVLLAVFLSMLTLFLDRRAVDMLAYLPKSLRDTQVSGARALMSIISQSTFGVAGVMFSMTMVAVSFASGNFGPRLIGNFMRDRGNQLSLGVLIATFVYALMITRAIQDPVSAQGISSIDAFVPHLSIGVALILMAVSVFTVIYFVHHIPETINVSNITADLGKRLIANIKILIEAQQADDTTPIPWPDRDPDVTLTLGVDGYIQALNKTRIETIARDNDLVIDLPRPIGDFVASDAIALCLWGREPDEETCKDLRACFAIGQSRTEYQNLLFLIDQLVEMTGRALSPGVNDPFTAINCLNWIYAAALTGANHQGGLVATEPGRVRLASVTFEDILDAGFGASDAYTRTDRLCENHVLTLMDRLDNELKAADHRATLQRFRERLARGDLDVPVTAGS